MVKRRKAKNREVDYFTSHFNDKNLNLYRPGRPRQFFKSEEDRKQHLKLRR